MILEKIFARKTKFDLDKENFFYMISEAKYLLISDFVDKNLTKEHFQKSFDT